MIDLLQVDHSREGVELLEDVIRAAVLRELCDRPLRISGVTEGDGARRTRRCASGRELIGRELTMLERGAILRLTDALHAKAALLHHTFAAHRDIRIELPVERLGERVLLAPGFAIAEPVEVADLIRAIVRAVARADATVVHLHVQSVGRVVGRIHRAHRLARRVTTMLTEHRNKSRLELIAEASVIGALEVALDTKPRHLAPASDVESG